MSKSLKNVKPKIVEIELDRVRHLVFDLNAFAEMEEKLGSIEEALTELAKGRLKSLRTILWSGLLHEDEELTEKQVGSMIGLANLQDVANKLNESISSALPDVDEKGKAKSKTDPK